MVRKGFRDIEEYFLQAEAKRFQQKVVKRPLPKKESRENLVNQIKNLNEKLKGKDRKIKELFKEIAELRNQLEALKREKELLEEKRK